MRRQSRPLEMGAACLRPAQSRGHGFIVDRHGIVTNLIVTLLAGVGFPLHVSAHPLLGNCVQHRIFLTVDPVNIDIEIELTFTDTRAMAERHRMDADHDWTISPEEARLYARALESTQADGFTLSIDGRPVRLIPLYAPEIDLLSVPQMAPASLVVRLFYFAPTPSFLKAGSDFTFTNRLWPDAPAMLAMTVAGEGGVRITTTPTDPLIPAGPVDSSRLLHARCTAIPEGGVGQAEKPADQPRQLATASPSPLAVQPETNLRPLWAVVLFAAALTAAAIYRYRPHRNT